MFCFQSRRLINLELDDRLPAHRIPVLERHLADCAECRRYRDELLLARRLLRAPDAGPSPSFEWTLQLRLNRALQEAASGQVPWEEPTPGWRSWWRNFALSSLAGAAVAVALVVWMLPVQRHGIPGQQGREGGAPVAALQATPSRSAPPTVGSTAGAADRRPLAAPGLFAHNGTAGGFGQLASTPRYWASGYPVSPRGDTGEAGLIERLLRENEILRSQVLILQSRNRSLQALLAEGATATLVPDTSEAEGP